MTEPYSLAAQKSGLGYRILRAIKRDKLLFLMFLPIFAYYIIFNYIPMTGAIISFKQFRPGGGIYNGDWVGLKWFIQFFESPFAYRTIRNTVLISFYSILFGFPMPILFAVCVMEIRHNKARRVLQTVSYLPHFISTVVLVGMINNFITMNNGIVNMLISLLGGEEINFLVNPRWFRTLYVGSSVWQSFGFNSIIYIAAITGIDPTLYEAGKMDGISRFQEVVYITIPMISNTIIMLFIMQVGRIMSVGFEKVYLLQNTLNSSASEIISTYVYKMGLVSSQYSLSAAIGLFNNIINLVLLLSVNYISKKMSDTSLV